MITFTIQEFIAVNGDFQNIGKPIIRLWARCLSWKCENKPSRTITATKIANSRESIIYKSEIERIGDGEYRLPTIREAAIYMEHHYLPIF